MPCLWDTYLLQRDEIFMPHWLTGIVSCHALQSHQAMFHKLKSVRREEKRGHGNASKNT